jgi:2-C-methyl-D-erythritol 4-phosphate cytidylyltransferase
VTDESMAMEQQGLRPLLVEGSQDNLKITTIADVARFEWLLAQR